MPGKVVTFFPWRPGWRTAAGRRRRTGPSGISGCPRIACRHRRGIGGCGRGRRCRRIALRLRRRARVDGSRSHSSRGTCDDLDFERYGFAVRRQALLVVAYLVIGLNLDLIFTRLGSGGHFQRDPKFGAAGDVFRLHAEMRLAWAPEPSITEDVDGYCLNPGQFEQVNAYSDDCSFGSAATISWGYLSQVDRPFAGI